MDWLAENSESIVDARKPWKVVIVDDDAEVHKVTQLAMKSFDFMGRKLEFYSAHSGKEAKTLLSEHDDIAIILLDVVMETDDAGLKLVNYIRNEIGNTSTRIILRTGQAGLTSENEIIENYDIDGYKTKTEITLQNLHNLFYVALRSYRDISRLDSYKNALKALLNSLLKINKLDHMEEFSANLLAYLSHVLDAYHSELIVNRKKASLISVRNSNREIVTSKAEHSFEQDITGFIDKVIDAQDLVYEGQLAGIYHRNTKDVEAVVVIEIDSELDKNAIELIEVFAEHICHMVSNIKG